MSEILEAEAGLGSDAARRFVDALQASSRLWCAKQVRATLHATVPVAEALAIDAALRRLWAERAREAPQRQFVWATGDRGVARGTFQLTALDGAGRELLTHSFGQAAASAA